MGLLCTQRKIAPLSHMHSIISNIDPPPPCSLYHLMHTQSQKMIIYGKGGSFLFEAGDIRICFCTYAIQVLQTLSAFVYIYVYSLYFLRWKRCYWNICTKRAKRVCRACWDSGEWGNSNDTWHCFIHHLLVSIIVLLIICFFIFIQHFCKWMIRLAWIDTSIQN
jgi:hypothetical protein